MIAKIVGSDILENELIQLVDSHYLTISKTTTERVKLSTISRLASLLKHLSPAIRENYADVFHNVTIGGGLNWRLRLAVAKQIGELTTIFSTTTVMNKIVPLYFSFCKD